MMSTEVAFGFSQVQQSVGSCCYLIKVCLGLSGFFHFFFDCVSNYI